MSSFDALLNRRSEPDARRVLADLRLERGERPGRLGVELWISAADADADAADSFVRTQLHKLLTGDIEMKDGLKVVQVPGRYGYSVTLVGWMRRVSGDEYELLNACTVARNGTYRLDGLQKLASDGPGLPANEKAWAEHCPRPKGWDAKAEAP